MKTISGGPPLRSLFLLTVGSLIGCGSTPSSGDAGAPGSDSGALDAGLIDGGSEDADFYISPAGMDTAGCGTLGNPCKTVSYTQPLVRALVATNPGRTVIVMLRGNAGPFWESGNLAFGPTDATQTTPVLWTAYPGETPVLSGGVAVTSAWTQTATNGGALWTTPLPDGTADFAQLFINGVRHFTPRAPPRPGSAYLYNAGAVCVDAGDPTYDGASCKPPSATGSVPCFNSTCPSDAPYVCFDRMRFDGGDISPSWQNIDAGTIIVDAFEDWTVPKLRLKSVQGDIAYFSGPTETDSQFHGFLLQHRYVVENVADDLTSQNGNWYVDESTAPWTLSYFTTGGDDPNQQTVVVPQDPTLLVANALQYVTFQGLTFSHDNWTVPAKGYESVQGEQFLPAAVSVVDSSHVTFVNCIFAHMGSYALEFKGSGTVTGTGNNQLLNSALYDIGGGGVRIGLPAQHFSNAYETGGNLVSNNVVTGVGRVVAGSPLIFVGNSNDNTVQFNEVYDGYGDGISVGVPNGNQSCNMYGNLIQYNHVHHTKQGVTSDGGGIYLYSYNAAHASNPNVIANNWVHDIATDPGFCGYGGEGVYLDNDSQNTTVQNNLVYRISAQPAFVNYGQGHTLSNNIFAFGTRGALSRGSTVGTVGPLSTPAFTASHNIFVWDQDVTAPGPHASWYPLGSSSWDCFGQPCTGQFDFSSNLYWTPQTGATPEFLLAVDAGSHAQSVPFSGAGSWQSSGEDVGSFIENPGFTNALCPTDDYTFSSTAAIGSIHFTPFDYQDAGRSSPGPTPGVVPVAFPMQAPADPCTFY
jgi:hypothetical protein